MSSTLSTFLNLWKPTPGSKEPYNQTEENSNLDKIDAAIGPKFTNTANPVSPDNTTTETQVFGANILAASQQSVWRIVVWGYAGCTATPTLTIRAKLGGVQIGSVVITYTGAGTNRHFRAQCEIVCITTGVSGTWGGVLKLLWNDGTTDRAAVNGALPTFTRDTTISNTFEVTAQWSAANAANEVTLGGGYVHRVTNA